MIWLILLTILSAVLYRMGGVGEPFNTKHRDLGCPTCVLLGCFSIGVTSVWWAHLLAFLLLFGALTTYWDFLFHDWDNFWLHGFMCGVAAFPLAISSGAWLGWGIRCLVLAITMGAWSALVSDDEWEEWGRGAFLVATLPLLLIGGWNG